jgi:NAD(P)-dependent dehydrogenase (short-subunit alcohol dehydrogenase family)
MSPPDASQLLRAGLLDATAVLVAGPAPADEPVSPAEGVAPRIVEQCAALGAEVRRCAVLDEAGHSLAEEAIEADVGRVLGELGRIDVLVVDCGALFAAAGEERDRDGLVGSLDGAWTVTRAVAGGAFLAAGQPGRIIYVAPRPSAGPHAEAARAGLENLARTLSIEWSRHRLAPLAIAPGDHTEPGELSALLAYLASPAGAYFSGCLLDLRGPAAIA